MTGRRLLRRGTALLAAAALPAVGLIGVAGPADAVPSACSGKPQDINGDGFGDIVVGEPRGGAVAGGRIRVFYGTANGPTATPVLDAPDDQIFAQGVAGVPGADAKGDFFGGTVSMGDFNDDGCADVAIGAPGNNGRRGSLTVLYGKVTGLDATGAQFLTENTVAAGTALPDEQFGNSIAVGDFDADGVDDLAVGALFDVTDLGTGERGGSVTVFYGSATGVNSGRAALTITQDSPGIATASENGDEFGWEVAAGNVNGDAADDLAVSSPGENTDAGSIDVMRGSATGVVTSGAAHWTQNSPGIPGTEEKGDILGISLELGDLDGDGFDDVAVGAPGENKNTGWVHVIRGSATGTTATGTQVLTQDTAGVDGVGAGNDFFGWAVSVGNFDGDTFKDLAVGVPQDSAGASGFGGSVQLFKGSATGASTAGYGGTRLTQDTPGVAGAPEDVDGFGYNLAAAQIDGSGLDSLVVSVPFEALGGLKAVGQFTAFTPSANGPTGTGSDTFEPDSPGVAGARKAEARFGLVIE